MGLIRLALAALFTAVLTGAASAAGPKIVSINLCTDQLALELADPDQILGLGPFAVDQLRSPFAERAAAFRRLSGAAEEVISIRPDLVLAGRYTRRATRELVRAQGLPLVELDPPRTVAEAIGQLRDMAARLGHPERGEAAVVGIERALAAARAVASGRRESVLALQRRGWIAGGGAMIGSIMEAVGLRNAGAELAKGLGRQVSLEVLVASRPDLLLLGSASERADDQGSALLQHPALRRLWPPDRRLVLPERLGASCGGASLADALAWLTRAVERLP